MPPKDEQEENGLGLDFDNVTVSEEGLGLDFSKAGESLPADVTSGLAAEAQERYNPTMAQSAMQAASILPPAGGMAATVMTAERLPGLVQKLPIANSIKKIFGAGDEAGSLLKQAQTLGRGDLATPTLATTAASSLAGSGTRAGLDEAGQAAGILPENETSQLSRTGQDLGIDVALGWAGANMVKKVFGTLTEKGEDIVSWYKTRRDPAENARMYAGLTDPSKVKKLGDAHKELQEVAKDVLMTPRYGQPPLVHSVDVNNPSVAGELHELVSKNKDKIIQERDALVTPILKEASDSARKFSFKELYSPLYDGYKSDGSGVVFMKSMNNGSDAIIKNKAKNYLKKEAELILNDPNIVSRELRSKYQLAKERIKSNLGSEAVPDLLSPSPQDWRNTYAQKKLDLRKGGKELEGILAEDYNTLDEVKSLIENSPKYSVEDISKLGKDKQRAISEYLRNKSYLSADSDLSYSDEVNRALYTKTNEIISDALMAAGKTAEAAQVKELNKTIANHIGVEDGLYRQLKGDLGAEETLAQASGANIQASSSLKDKVRAGFSSLTDISSKERLKRIVESPRSSAWEDIAAGAGYTTKTAGWLGKQAGQVLDPRFNPFTSRTSPHPFWIAGSAMAEEGDTGSEPAFDKALRSDVVRAKLAKMDLDEILNSYDSLATPREMVNPSVDAAREARRVVGSQLRGLEKIQMMREKSRTMDPEERTDLLGMMMKDPEVRYHFGEPEWPNSLAKGLYSYVDGKLRDKADIARYIMRVDESQLPLTVRAELINSAKKDGSVQPIGDLELKTERVRTEEKIKAQSRKALDSKVGGFLIDNYPKSVTDSYKAEKDFQFKKSALDPREKASYAEASEFIKRANSRK